MANFELIASPRSETRKGAMRRLRSTGASRPCSTAPART